MNCDDIISILGLEDLDRRADPDVMARHLERCAGCRQRFPEVAALYGINPVATTVEAERLPLKFQPWLRVASVAAVVLAVTWIGIAVWPQAKTQSNDAGQTDLEQKPGRAFWAETDGAAEASVSYETETTIVSRIENGRVVQVVMRQGRVVHGLTHNRSDVE